MEQNCDTSALNIKQEECDVIVKTETEPEIIVIDEPSVELIPAVDSEKNEDKSSSTSHEVIHNKREGQQKAKKKVIGSQARELIAMIYHHMKKEALNGVRNLTDAHWRTAQATGVSLKTVYRILKEKRKADETGTPMRSPLRNRKPRKCIRREMQENQEVIRETIENYEKEHNKPLTLQAIQSILREKIGFNGCIETLRNVLNVIGYDLQAKKNNGVLNKKLGISKNK